MLCYRPSFLLCLSYDKKTRRDGMPVLNGIDISNYQRGLDVRTIKADFVIVKASEGIGYEDPSCHTFAKAALSSKKKLGLYHFARPGKENPAVKEAEWFLRIFKPYIGKAIPVLDWEAEEIGNVKWAKQWLDEVFKKTRVRPWIYMSESVANSHNWSQVAKHYRLWMALYRSNAPAYNYDMRNAGTLVSTRYWKSTACWQWTSHGRLAGWNGNLDFDRFYGNRTDWDEETRRQEDRRKKSNEQIAAEVIAGKWGQGAERDQRLKKAGYDPKVIMALVDEKTRKKSTDEIAEEVIKGKWGNGEERIRRLEAAGYDAKAVQKRVNERLQEMSKEYYTVRKGDTLEKIARRFATSVQRLAEMNHLPDPNYIVVGQCLRVR